MKLRVLFGLQKNQSSIPLPTSVQCPDKIQDSNSPQVINSEITMDLSSNRLNDQPGQALAANGPSIFVRDGNTSLSDIRNVPHQVRVTGSAMLAAVAARTQSGPRTLTSTVTLQSHERSAYDRSSDNISESLDTLLARLPQTGHQSRTGSSIESRRINQSSSTPIFPIIAQGTVNNVTSTNKTIVLQENKKASTRAWQRTT